MLEKTDRDRLIRAVIEPAHREVWGMADCAGGSEEERALRAVALSAGLIEAMQALRDWVAGEAEAAGVQVTQIGAAIGGSSNQSNIRRKMPQMRQFADARREADSSGEDQQVWAYGWPVIVTPHDAEQSNAE